MTYPEGVAYLESLVDFERLGFRRHYADTVSLDTIRALLKRLGNPQRGLPCVHIAGTKGKGSTAAILESILTTAGLKVGLFSSPHLVSFRERIRIGQKIASEEEIAWAVEQVRPAIEALRQEGKLNPSTFFEAYTAMAYLLFRKHGVKLAIMEAGLGGRLDATNTCEPVACAITTLGLDHTEILGETIEEIAREKAGIIKPGVPCVTAPQEPAVMMVLQEVADAVGARLSSAAAAPEDLELALFGEHQRINLGVALGLVEILREEGHDIPEEAVREGCRKVRWPGRLQIIGERPWVVLDVAHNEAAAKAVAEALPRMVKYERLIAVVGLSAEKDAAAFCRVLAPLVEVAILTQAQISRALPVAELVQASEGMWRETVVAGDVATAMRLAHERAGAGDCILVTGSFYVVGEAMRGLEACGFGDG